jgi:hypothetical protein
MAVSKPDLRSKRLSIVVAIGARDILGLTNAYLVLVVHGFEEHVCDYHALICIPYFLPLHYLGRSLLTALSVPVATCGVGNSITAVFIFQI